MKGSIIKIDSREPHGIQQLELEGCLKTVETLAVGDLQIIKPSGTKLVIERKTPSDFWNSIKDKRLFDQVANLVCCEGLPYLWIQGRSLEGSNMNWNAIQGALLAIQEMGVVIVYHEDPYKVLPMLVDRADSAIKIKPRKQPYIFSPKESVLAALPGIGSERAIMVLDAMKGHLGFALEYLTRLDDPEVRIPGIGQKTKVKINQLFDGVMTHKGDTQ